MLLFYTAELGRQGKLAEMVELILKQPEPRSISLIINLALAHSRMGRLSEGERVLKERLEQPDLSIDDQQKLRALISEMEKAD